LARLKSLSSASLFCKGLTKGTAAKLLPIMHSM
jgi:hypothetical protein